MVFLSCYYSITTIERLSTPPYFLGGATYVFYFFFNYLKVFVPSGLLKLGFKGFIICFTGRSGSSSN
jgi:hypothetical protein